MSAASFSRYRTFVKILSLSYVLFSEEFGDLPSSNLSIVKRHPMSGFKPLNLYQEKAVKEALSKPFTLVQGPPGKQNQIQLM